MATFPQLNKVKLSQLFYPSVTINTDGVDLIETDGMRRVVSTNPPEFIDDLGIKITSEPVSLPLTSVECPNGEKDLLFWLTTGCHPTLISKCQLGNIQEQPGLVNFNNPTQTHAVVKFTPEVSYNLHPNRAERQSMTGWVTQLHIPTITYTTPGSGSGGNNN